jgi:hypothetical protein
MAGIQVTIGSEIFATKAAAVVRCREILWAYKPGDVVRPEHAVFLHDLIERHPDAERKIGCGVARFSVDQDSHNGQCFWLTRHDGSRTEFAFKWCITPQLPKQAFTIACRNGVLGQVLAFRDAAFNGSAQIPCAISGVLVSIADSHIDHTPPDTFASLRDRFISDCAIDWESVPLSGREDGCTYKQIADPEVLRLWREYHQEHARLRILSISEHKKVSAGR